MSVSQVVIATGNELGATRGLVSAWSRQGQGDWVRDLGPYAANFGYGGLVPAARKHEGDGGTPSGTYTLTTTFGVAARPVTLLPWHAVVRGDSWDDDPASPRYNLLIPVGGAAGRSPELLYNVPAYNEAVVIDYNNTRVPGAGSAIFLHVTTGGATAGCVSIPAAGVLAILAWLRPDASPEISIGTADHPGVSSASTQA